mgnify:CR=1 FL=1
MKIVDFITNINTFHNESDIQKTIEFLNGSTKLGFKVCKEIIKNNWTCAKEGYLGDNIYSFIVACANETAYDPVVEKNTGFYVKYLDQPAAEYALKNIKKF